MNRGDDLLAGARLPRQQHRRLGLRDTRGLRQNVAPLLRVADDAALAAARFELPRERGDLRLEPCGRLARLGVASRGVGQPLVRQRERQMVRHAAREVEVVFAETIGIAREEEDRPEHVLAERHRHTQRRFHPETVEHAPADRVGRDSPRAPRASTYASRLSCSRSEPVSVMGAQKAGSSTCAPAIAYRRNERAVHAPRRDGEDVVRKPAANDIGDLREHLPEIERLGHRVEQAAEAVDSLAPERFALDDGGALEGERRAGLPRRRGEPGARR